MGQSEFKFASADNVESVEWESEDSLRFMKVVGEESRLVLKHVTKHFDLEESWHNLHPMKAIIESMQATRLARLIPATPEIVVKDFQGVDRSPVRKFWAKEFKFSLDKGERPG